MKCFVIPAASVLAMALMTAGCGGDNGPGIQSGRGSCYDRLDLSTPVAAVEQFLDACSRQDYLRAYLVLSPRAQSAWWRSVHMLEFGNWFGEEFQPDPIIPDTDEWEHAFAGWYTFDHFMRQATRQTALRVGFIGAADLGTPAPATTENGLEVMDVPARTAEGEPILFRTIQAPSGKWRVLSVLKPREDQPALVWGPSELPW